MVWNVFIVLLFSFYVMINTNENIELSKINKNYINKINEPIMIYLPILIMLAQSFFTTLLQWNYAKENLYIYIFAMTFFLFNFLFLIYNYILSRR